MATFYVKPSSYATGANDGTSDLDAWQGFASVLWNGVAGVEVNAGDTLIATGVFVDESLSFGVNGTSGNEVTINLTSATMTHATSSCITSNQRSYFIINGGTLGGSTTTNAWDATLFRGSNITFNNTIFLGGLTESVRLAIDSTTEGVTDVAFYNCTFNKIFRINYSPTATFILDGCIVDNCVFNLTGIQTFIGDDALIATGGIRTINTHITNCSFYYPDTVAIAIKGWDLNTSIVDNYIIGAGSGGDPLINAIQTGNTKYTKIIGNTILDTTTGTDGDGHCIIGDHVTIVETVYDSEELQIIGNYCTTSVNSSATQRAGINMWRAKNCIVAGNICVNNIHGIRQQNLSSTGNVYYNNVLSDNVLNGFNVASSGAACELINNIMSNNGTYGINTSGTDPTESYNYFYNNGTWDIRLNAGTEGTIDTTSNSADPVISSDYIPSVDSPCYHAGTFVRFGLHDHRGHRFNIPPTIGAYEFTSGSQAQTRTARTTAVERE